MGELLALLDKIYPLYFIVLLGFVAGKFLKADSKTVSTLLIFILLPLVVFNGIVTNSGNNTYLLLPVVFFLAASFLSLVFYYVAGLFWKTEERNLISYMAGTGNTAYFGIPLILSLYGESGIRVAVFASLGLILFHSSVGYYIFARSQATAKEAIRKVLRLPALYAFACGLIVSQFDVQLSGSVGSVFGYINGAYTVLGMMILGMGLVTASPGFSDKLFTSVSFVAKFACYPLLIGSLVYLDSQHFHLFSGQVHSIVMVLSVTPLAVTTVTYATHFNTKPQKAAVTVMLSTLFALIYIPIFIAVFL